MARKREHSEQALEAFAQLCDELGERPEFSQARWFGLPAGKVSDKVFVALHGDSLVAKLGAEEVSRRVAAGEGEHFDPSGKGRAMKDWLESRAPAADWPSIGDAAYGFVASGS